MDEKVARLIQREGAAALLDPGRVRPLEGYPPSVPQAPAPAGRHAPPPAGRAYSLGPGVPLVRGDGGTDEQVYEGGGNGLFGDPRQTGEPHGGLYPVPRLDQPPSAGRDNGMAGSQLDRHRVCLGRHAQLRVPVGHRPFYDYYQISREDEPDEAETEPKKQGELKTVFEPSHSPFGFVWQVADATGWKVKYILEGVNFQTLIMMLADAPRYIRKKQEEKSAEDEAADIVGFFQSNLKR